MKLLFKRVKRGLHAYRRVTAFYAVTIFASICVFVAFVQSGYGIEASYKELCEECSTSDILITGIFNREQIQEVSQISNVNSVSAKLTTVAELNTVSDKYNIVIDIYDEEPELDKYKIIEGKNPDNNTVAISYGFAKYNGICIGEEIDIVTANGLTKSATISGFYVCASEAYAASVNELNGKNGKAIIFDEISEYNCISVSVSNSINSFVENFNQLGWKNCHVSETYNTESFLAIKNTTNDYMLIGSFIGVIVLIIGVVLAVFFIVRLIASQNKSIASLRAISYPKNKIVSYYVLLITCITFFAALVGLIGGGGISYLIQRRFIKDLKLPETSNVCIVAIASIPCVIVLISIVAFLVSFRIVNKPIFQIFNLTVSKQSRHVLIERIPFIWNKMSSQTQNSVRMIARHKARGIMSIVGISMGLTLCMTVLAINYFNSDFSRAMLDQTCNYTLIVTGSSTGIFDRIVNTVKQCESVTNYNDVYNLDCMISYDTNSYSGKCLLLSDDDTCHNVFSTNGDIIKIPETGIVINKSIADNLGAALEQNVYLENNEKVAVNASISAICGQYYGVGLFMNQSAYQELFGCLPKTKELLISTTDPKAVIDLIEEIEGAYCIDIKEEFELLQKNNESSVLTFFAIAGIGTLFAFILFVSTTSISAAERERETIILRSLGIRNSEIIISFMKEWSVSAFLGLIISIPTAKMLILCLEKMTVRDYTLLFPQFVPGRCILFAIAVLLFSVIVSLLLFYLKLRIIRITDLGSKE